MDENGWWKLGEALYYKRAFPRLRKVEILLMQDVGDVVDFEDTDNEGDEDNGDDDEQDLRYIEGLSQHIIRSLCCPLLEVEVKTAYF